MDIDTLIGVLAVEALLVGIAWQARYRITRLAKPAATSSAGKSKKKVSKKK